MVALAALASEGHLRLPVRHGSRWDRTSVVAVPLEIRLKRATEGNGAADWRAFPWHPKLQWVLTCKQLTVDQVAFLQEIHAGIVGEKFAEPVPFKYRSLQLTGDEKRLASFVTSQLFSPMRLTLELIGCEPDILPLAWESISPLPNLLMFENSGSFLVGLRVLRSMNTPPYGGIAYGGGTRMLKAIPYLRILGRQFDVIDYVGDLDGKGLEIAISLQQAVKELGLGRLQPATRLHMAMLRSAATLGAPSGWPVSNSRRTHGSCKDSVRFLDESLRDQVISVLNQERRIPEEVLGHDEMRCTFSRSDKSEFPTDFPFLAESDCG